MAHGFVTDEKIRHKGRLFSIVGTVLSLLTSPQMEDIHREMIPTSLALSPESMTGSFSTELISLRDMILEAVPNPDIHQFSMEFREVRGSYRHCGKPQGGRSTWNHFAVDDPYCALSALENISRQILEHKARRS